MKLLLLLYSDLNVCFLAPPTDSRFVVVIVGVVVALLLIVVVVIAL